MRFGIIIPGVRPAPGIHWDPQTIARGAKEVATMADRLGYDFVTVPDHIVVPRATEHELGPKWYDPIATLAFIAGVTSRIRLVLSVRIIPYRSPFQTAKEVATLDVLSKGRVVFGIGVGHYRPEFETLGVPYNRRGAMTDEALPLIRRLLTEDAVAHQGTFYQCDEVVLDPKPVQKHLPVWVGGNSRAAAGRAFVLGDGWMPFQLTDEEFSAQLAHGRQSARDAGRTGAVDIVATVGNVQVAEDVTPALAGFDRVRRGFEASRGTAGYREQVARGFDAGALRTAEQVAEKIDEAANRGATHCRIGFKFRDLPQYLEAVAWFGREVLPRYG